MGRVDRCGIELGEDWAPKATEVALRLSPAMRPCVVLRRFAIFARLCELFSFALLLERFSNLAARRTEWFRLLEGTEAAYPEPGSLTLESGPRRLDAFETRFSAQFLPKAPCLFSDSLSAPGKNVGKP